LKGSREAALAAAELARDPDAFKQAFEAFRASDGDRFRAALERVGLLDRCRVICVFFCRKRCVGVCRRFCPGDPPDVTAQEVREFALTYAKLGDEQLRRLVEIISAEDVQAWQDELKKLELTRFCHQVYHLLCEVRCRRHCFELCPPAPPTSARSRRRRRWAPRGSGTDPESRPPTFPRPTRPRVWETTRSAVRQRSRASSTCPRRRSTSSRWRTIRAGPTARSRSRSTGGTTSRRFRSSSA